MFHTPCVVSFIDDGKVVCICIQRRKELSGLLNRLSEALKILSEIVVELSGCIVKCLIISELLVINMVYIINLFIFAA